MISKRTPNLIYISIGILWLFHISAMLGIALNQLDWFASKTPLNLLLCLLFFILVYPLDHLKKYVAFAIFFTGGMLAEWLGVNYNLLFGTYSYGNNFGVKLDGVPILIGVNWALLTFITATIAYHFTKRAWLKIIFAALLMVFLDYFMEHSAPILDFWAFKGGIAPLENYITWFIIAIVFQTILHFFNVRGNKLFSFHLYFAQLIFFIYLYFLFS